MAKARMLHKKISTSLQVNDLPLPAKLLFTWLIPHADAEGKLKGEPVFIKAMIVPMTNWSLKLIKKYLEQMSHVGLIYYWQRENEWFIEFPKWEAYQTIRKNREEPSSLPSFNNKNGNQMPTNPQPDGNQMAAQYNINETNTIQINKSEDNKVETFAKNSSNEEDYSINPHRFDIRNKGQQGALDAWKALESDKPMTFYTTYLAAYHKGLPATYFYQFVSEIKQDASIENPGAVFNSKVDNYFANQKKKKSE